MKKVAHYEIDQSIKIEQTERDTVIACVNHTERTVLLSRKTKRDLQVIFKRRGKPRFFPYFVFSALIAILLFEVNPKNKVIIDKEYSGYESLILERTHTFLKILGRKHIDLSFGHIGKTTQAHKVAASISLKKKKPSRLISMNEVADLVFGH